MKKLGLIGGTGPESTIIYYRDITGGVQKKLETEIFPYLNIESLSVFDVLDYCKNEDYEGLTEYLLNGIENLKRAGADFGALTGITPHIVFNKLKERASLPIVSMVDTSLEYAKRKEYKKIALLGTIPTMNGEFFKAPFESNGIKVITPSQGEKEYISCLISNELEYGIVTQEACDNMKSISMRMIKEDGVEAIVLGCTELPLVFDKLSLPVDKMDVMRIHIEKLIDMIIEK